MKKLNAILLAMQLVFACSYSQVPIHSPGVFNDFTVTPAMISAEHGAKESVRAPFWISSITAPQGCVQNASCTPNFSNQKWPAGTWYNGYAEIILPPGGWCAGPYNGTYEYSARPLVRNSEDQGRAYMHLDNMNANPLYRDRMNWAADYLAHTAQSSLGAWIYWLKRPNCLTGNSFDEMPGINQFDRYETSRALKTIIDAYWYRKKIGDPTANDLYSSIESGANFLLTAPTGATTNYPGFMAWALASAYKVTGDSRYFLKAKELCEHIMQDQQSFGNFEGAWITGGTNNLPDPFPQHIVYHDSQIWYHQIIIRGLVETMSCTPAAYSTFKMDLRNSIARAVNHIVDHRFNPNGNNLIGYYLDVNGNMVSPNLEKYVVYDIEWICLLTQYAQNEPLWSPADRTNLEYIMNRLALAMTSAEVEYLKQLAFYADYSDAINTNRSLEKKVQVDYELLQKYNGLAKIYSDDDGLNIGTNPIYNGLLNLNKWIAGDFDGDGQDELLYKFDGPQIFRTENPANMPTGTSDMIYTLNSQLETWVAGDFNGDGDDELLYKFLNNNVIYLSEDGTNLNTLTPASLGTAPLDKWITGDFNGDNKTDLLCKFTNSPTIFNYNYGLMVENGTQVYTGNQHLENWLVGNFINIDAGNYMDPDEIIYKFINNPTVYSSSTGVIFGNVAMITLSGTNTIDEWIACDFDGDHNDELLFKYTNANTCYFSSNGKMTNPVTIYSGNYSLEKWIAADFDGDGNEELLNKFSGLNKIYRTDDGQALGAQQLVYDGSYALGNWLVLKFDGGTNTSKMAHEEEVEISGLPGMEIFAYPNPSDGRFRVNYFTPFEGQAKISLHTLTGQEMAVLFEGEVLQGTGVAEWNGGETLAPGIYLLKIKSGVHEAVSRVSVMK